MYCVYKLENDRGEIYFGKTNNPKDRWKHHRNGNAKCTSGILWEDNGVVEDIEVLEWFDTEELALEREKELIRNNNCVNLRGKYTKSELKKRWYYKDHAATLEKRRLRGQTEECKKKRREECRRSYEKNKEKRNARVRERIKCDICGSMIQRTYKAKHQRTAKCKSF